MLNDFSIKMNIVIEINYLNPSRNFGSSLALVIVDTIILDENEMLQILFQIAIA